MYFEIRQHSSPFTTAFLQRLHSHTLHGGLSTDMMFIAYMYAYTLKFPFIPLCCLSLEKKCMNSFFLKKEEEMKCWRKLERQNHVSKPCIDQLHM